MNSHTFNRLQSLRMENDAAGFAMDEMRPRFDKLAARHENGAAPRAVTAFQLFQTPAELARRLVEALNMKRGSRVLEPSAGLGRILDALKPQDVAEVVAVEIAASCAGELFKQDRPGVRILQRDFLALTPEETGLFDYVVMNPPFHMRADIRHIQHALRFLKPGGRCAALCFDTHHRATAMRDRADTWEPLPAGLFGKEGTGVATVLATFTAKEIQP